VLVSDPANWGLIVESPEILVPGGVPLFQLIKSLGYPTFLSDASAAKRQFPKFPNLLPRAAKLLGVVRLAAHPDRDSNSHTSRLLPLWLISTVDIKIGEPARVAARY